MFPILWILLALVYTMENHYGTQWEINKEHRPCFSVMRMQLIRFRNDWLMWRVDAAKPTTLKLLHLGLVVYTNRNLLHHCNRRMNIHNYQQCFWMFFGILCFAETMCTSRSSAPFTTEIACFNGPPLIQLPQATGCRGRVNSTAIVQTPAPEPEDFNHYFCCEWRWQTVEHHIILGENEAYWHILNILTTTKLPLSTVFRRSARFIHSNYDICNITFPCKLDPVALALTYNTLASQCGNWPRTYMYISFHIHILFDTSGRQTWWDIKKQEPRYWYRD